MTTRVYSEKLNQKVRFLQSETDGEIEVYDLGSFVME